MWSRHAPAGARGRIAFRAFPPGTTVAITPLQLRTGGADGPDPRTVGKGAPNDREPAAGDFPPGRARGAARIAGLDLRRRRQDPDRPDPRDGSHDERAP